MVSFEVYCFGSYMILHYNATIFPLYLINILCGDILRWCKYPFFNISVLINVRFHSLFLPGILLLWYLFDGDFLFPSILLHLWIGSLFWEITISCYDSFIYSCIYLFIYSFDYLYKYGLIDIYFMCYNSFLSLFCCYNYVRLIRTNKFHLCPNFD